MSVRLGPWHLCSRRYYRFNRVCQKKTCAWQVKKDILRRDLLPEPALVFSSPQPSFPGKCQWRDQRGKPISFFRLMLTAPTARAAFHCRCLSPPSAGNGSQDIVEVLYLLQLPSADRRLRHASTRYTVLTAVLYPAAVAPRIEQASFDIGARLHGPATECLYAASSADNRVGIFARAFAAIRRSADFAEIVVTAFLAVHAAGVNNAGRRQQ